MKNALYKDRGHFFLASLPFLGKILHQLSIVQIESIAIAYKSKNAIAALVNLTLELQAFSI